MRIIAPVRILCKQLMSNACSIIMDCLGGERIACKRCLQNGHLAPIVMLIGGHTHFSLLLASITFMGPKRKEDASSLEINSRAKEIKEHHVRAYLFICTSLRGFPCLLFSSSSVFVSLFCDTGGATEVAKACCCRLPTADLGWGARLPLLASLFRPPPSQQQPPFHTRRVMHDDV